MSVMLSRVWVAAIANAVTATATSGERYLHGGARHRTVVEQMCGRVAALQVRAVR